MDFAGQVKAQVDIVRTVGEYVKLRRMGARYVGLCPFHTEKTPSFNVNPSLQIYKCFGCGVAGDVIKFIQEIDSLTFWEALTALAERNGIPLPQRTQHSDAETELRAAVFDMYETAAKMYSENLFGSAAQEVRDYLVRRGLSGSVAQEFRLGYSDPSWDALFRRIGRRYSPDQLEASGLFGRREDGGFYDKFRGRLMFPIQNETGKVIGFGGRALKDGDEPKYLNSPETKIYRKSNVLYNLHRAKDGIRKSDFTVLVEGYMDVIGVYAAGVRNVVASCGTALTAAQVRSIKRHSQSIVVNFDPDVAGANATERSLQMLLDEGMHVRVLELADGLDPDEYIKKNGAGVYQQKLGKAAGYFIWLCDRARKNFDMSTSEGRMKGYEVMLLPAIRRISDKLERASVATEVAQYLGLDQNLVLAEFRKMAGHRPQPASQTSDAIPARERILLRSILCDRAVRDILIPKLEGSQATRAYSAWRLFESVCALYSTEPDFSYESFERRLSDQQKTVLSTAVFADKSNEVFTAEQATAFASQLDAEDLQVECRALEVEIKAAERDGNFQKAIELIRRLEDMKRCLRQAPA